MPMKINTATTAANTAFKMQESTKPAVEVAAKPMMPRHPKETMALVTLRNESDQPNILPSFESLERFRKALR